MELVWTIEWMMMSREMRRRASQSEGSGRGFRPPSPGGPPARRRGGCCPLLILILLAMATYVLLQTYVFNQGK